MKCRKPTQSLERFRENCPVKLVAFQVRCILNGIKAGVTLIPLSIKDVLLMLLCCGGLQRAVNCKYYTASLTCNFDKEQPFIILSQGYSCDQRFNILLCHLLSCTTAAVDVITQQQHRSSEIKGLCLMKLFSETLQNLLH